ncbi:ABC transporter ATP-binding protein [Paenibacillus glacialis]|uniref:ABC transporter ATP-binding protein n=1 Tax=Paenibacillus glacialis TaxID=494026 RepID=UPI0008398F5C|nr:energy-coupling factor transporter ATPase [Paenibacillus glacialis]
MSPEAINLDELTYTYEGDSKPTIKDMTLSIPEGQWIAIIGPGASGKSTLCQLLNGYLPRSGGGRREGSISIEGIDPRNASIADIAERVGVVFQDADAQLVQGNVEADVAFGPENLRVPPADIAHRISASLAAVGLTSHRYSRVRELSGGQRQRAATAAVLALEPRLFVFDDCTASLDSAAQVRFVQVCGSLHEQGRTVLNTSGRFDDVARAAERVIVLQGGAVVLDGPPQELLRKHAAQLVQLGLLPTTEWTAGTTAQRVADAASPGTGGTTIESPVSGGTIASPGEAGFTQCVADAESPVRNVISTSKTALLQLHKLSYTYPGGHQVLRDVSFTLQAGDWGMIVGENGSGKSTLSKLLMGLIPVPRNSVFWDGKDIAGRSVANLAEEIGYVFQQPEHQFVTHSVWDEVTYGFKSKSHKRITLTSQEVELAEQMLLAAGLFERRYDSPYMLSQGEKRILSVICQFVIPKRLVILDEPTSGIDYAGAERILALCRDKVQQGTALLMITHDPNLVARDTSVVLQLHQLRGITTKQHG